MATETVSSDHSTNPEQVEKEVPKEVTMEESISPPKEIEGKPKEADVANATSAAPLTESEEKVMEKEPEPPLVQEKAKAVEEEKSKAEESAGVSVTSAGPEEKIEDKQIETEVPATIEEVKKPNDFPVVDVPYYDKPELSKDSVPVAENFEVSIVDDKIKSEPEGQPEVKDLENTHEYSTKEVEETLEGQPKKVEIPQSVTDVLEKKEEQETELLEKTEIPESAAETVEKKVEHVEELPKETGIPESVSEAVETKMKAEELPPKEPEAKVVSNFEISEPEQKKEEASLPVPKLEDKPEEKPEITEQIEKESVSAELTEKLEAGTAKDGEIKHTMLMELLANDNEEANVEKKDIDVPPIEVAEKTGAEDKEKEAAKTDAQGSLNEEKIIKESEGRDAKLEEKEEKTGVTEELTKPEAKALEHVANSTSTPQAPEKVTEVEKASRDIELPVEAGSQKYETLASVETNKDVEVEKKVDVERPQKIETETKGEEAVAAVEPKAEQEKQVEETAKPDAPIQDTLKEAAPVKRAQKHSNNILAKVKQSLVKARKAITGKSPSKPPSSEAKGEVKAK